MAIFSPHHSFIGRSTHPARPASLNARHITGQDRCTDVLCERMPGDRNGLMKWLDKEEQSDRKNARVIDKVTVVLPLELTPEQNRELVRDYCERMTEGRASWAATFHDGPGDRDKPHAHIVLRDRAPETGKRVMLTSEKGSIERFREDWEQAANIALQRAGHDVRIDRRSLADQGIESEPQLHVGPATERFVEKAHEFHSNQKEVTRIIDGRRETVTINYPAIDQGSSRLEENEARKQRNVERTEYERAMGPVGLLDGERDRQTKFDEINKVDLKLDYLHQMLLSEDADLSPLANDALLQVAIEHHWTRVREGTARGLPWEPEIGDDQSGQKPARRDGFDLVGGGGLKILERISESFETLARRPQSSKGKRGKTNG